jgi:hypothetical protein
MHSDWPTTTPATGTFRFDLGDLYAAEPKPVLLELFVPLERLQLLKSDKAPIATLSVTADVILANGGVEHRTMHLPIASSVEGQQHMEPEIEFAVLLAHAARQREEAARLQREGRARDAAQLMSDLNAMEIPAFLSREQQEMLQKNSLEFGELARQYESGEFSELEAKYQMQRSYNARRGKLGYDEKLRRKRDE